MAVNGTRVLAGILVVELLLGAYQLTLLGPLLTTTSFARDAAGYDRVTAMMAVVVIAYVLTLVVIAVAFLAWFRRCHRNLTAFGLQPRHPHGWAVGAWFVPFLNLFRPKQMMDDVWAGSEAMATTGPHGWRSRPVPPLVTKWWALFLLVGVLTRLLPAGGQEGQLLADFVDAERMRLLMGLVVNGLDVVLCVVFIRLIQRVSDLQARAGRPGPPAQRPGVPPPGAVAPVVRW